MLRSLGKSTRVHALFFIKEEYSLFKAACHCTFKGESNASLIVLGSSKFSPNSAFKEFLQFYQSPVITGPVRHRS